MPFARLALRPGVDLTKSQTLNEGGVSKSQLIRWFGSLPQKIGGWRQLLGVPKLIGTCRSLMGWADLIGNAYLVAGTEQRLEVIAGGSKFDITPVIATTNPPVVFATTAASVSVDIFDPLAASPGVGDWIDLHTPVSIGGFVLQGFLPVTGVVDTTHYSVDAPTPAPATSTLGSVATFTTAVGSSTVIVTLGNHGQVVGQLYPVNVLTNAGGIMLAGTFPVQSVIDVNHFTIIGGSAATAAVTVGENGGNARIAYLLPSGYAVNTPLLGWGIGDWGAGDWGTGDLSAQAIAKLRTWSLDHWGEDLIASPSGGALYYWPPPVPAPAQLLSASAPKFNNGVFMQPQVQILIAYGSEVLDLHLPTLIRWCDSGDFTDWVASSTNQAGSYQIPTGSRLVSGLAIGLGALIWSDLDLWQMSYQGLPFVFGFNRIATNCEAISQKSPLVFGNAVIWPSNRAFFMLDGGAVRPVYCPVWDFFYECADFTQSEQIIGALNSVFSEAAWYFPIYKDVPRYNAHIGDIGFVKLNYGDPVHPWDYGFLHRIGWTDHSPYGNPIGATPDGLLMEHEEGFDDNGSPLIWSFTTGYFDIAEGTEFAFVDQIIPDVHAEDPIVLQVTIYATDWPSQEPRVYGPYPFTWPTDRMLNVRIRGRQMAIEVGSNDLGTFARMGAFRYRVSPAGRR